MKSWEWEKELKEEGREEGDLKRLISQICKKLAKGKGISVIADELEEDDTGFIEKIVEIASKCAPEYDIEVIYNEYINSLEDASVAVS